MRRPVGRAFVSLVRHHIGSVALGGAILPIVRFPRALIAFCVRRLCFPLWSTNTKSKWLVELRRFLSIHENAFSLMGTLTAPSFTIRELFSSTVLICVRKEESRVVPSRRVDYALIALCSAAMRGFSFFGGAFRAQELVAKNPCRVAALECLSDLLVFLAKIAVAALTFVAAFCLLAVCTYARDEVLIFPRVRSALSFSSLYRRREGTISTFTALCSSSSRSSPTSSRIASSLSTRCAAPPPPLFDSQFTCLVNFHRTPAAAGFRRRAASLLL